MSSNKVMADLVLQMSLACHSGICASHGGTSTSISLIELPLLKNRHALQFFSSRSAGLHISEHSCQFLLIEVAGISRCETIVTTSTTSKGTSATRVENSNSLSIRPPPMDRPALFAVLKQGPQIWITLFYEAEGDDVPHQDNHMAQPQSMDGGAATAWIRASSRRTNHA